MTSKYMMHLCVCVRASALTLWVTQGLVNELCSWEEALADVKRAFVHCRHIVVTDVPALVICNPCIDLSL